MTIIKKIAKNSGSLLLGRVFTKIITLFVVIYMVRYLGDADYGRYAFVFAFISFFTIISDFGMHSILVREIARSPHIAKKLLGNATIVSSFFSIVAFMTAVLAIYLMDYPIETKKLVWLASIELLLHAMLPFGVIYEVNLKMKYSVIFGVVNRVFLLIAVLAIVFYDLGLSLLVIVTVVSEALHNVLMVIFSRRFIWPDFSLDTDMCKLLLKESLPLALSSVFIIIYFKIDVIMLSMMKGDAAVGIYSASYRLTEAFIFIPSTLMVSMFPLMSRYFEKSKETFVFAYLKSFKYLFSIALPLAVGITFFADEIILLLYEVQFFDSIKVLQILIWATAIIFINLSLGQLLVSMNKQNITTISTAICALINVALNLILIPYFSYNGAAIATVITEFTCTCIMLYYLPDMVDLRKLLHSVRVPVFVTGLLFIFMHLANAVLNDLFIVILSLPLYLVLMYIFGGIDDDDKIILSKLVRNR